jgi:hypothetical protein
MITVISTGFRAPTAHLCRASVAAQVGVSVEHIYVEASEQDPPLTVSENLYNAVQGLPEERVCAWIDGDDWLAMPDALARVAKWYADDYELMLTYGSFVTSDGDPATWQGAYPHDADVRQHPWKASHLRTFRAGLFQRLTPEDLQLDGEWLSLGVDQAVMLPMLEMAGHTRRHFCPVPLVIYNTSTSWAAHARPADLEREAGVVARVRAKARKVRI